MNYFVVVEGVPRVYRIIENVREEFKDAREDFEAFGEFLGRSPKEPDILRFLDDLDHFLTEDLQEDEDIAVIRYGSKYFYVCCPHAEEDNGQAAYFIHGINALPETVLEGSGMAYWAE